MIKMVKVSETTHHLLKIRAAELKLTMAETLEYLLKLDDTNKGVEINESLAEKPKPVNISENQTNDEMVAQFIADNNLT